MKSLLSISFSLLFILQSFSQQHYTFSELTDEYQPLTSPTIVEEHNFINDALTAIPLDGETFNFFGVDFTFNSTTTLRIQSFGDLRVDNDTSAVLIDGVFTTLAKADSTTNVSYQVEGVAPNIVVKVQWQNVTLPAGPSGNHCSFQIWLHQQYGVVELRYGDRSDNNASPYNGSNGPYAGMFFSNNLFNNMYQKIWLYGDPQNIGIDTAKTFGFGRLRGIPNEGTVWRFTPKKYKDSVFIGISENRLNDLDIYPNPVEHQLTVSGIEVNSPIQYVIYSLSGKKMLNGQLNPDDHSIPVQSLPKGAFIIEFHQNNLTKQQRLIKL